MRSFTRGRIGVLLVCLYIVPVFVLTNCDGNNKSPDAVRDDDKTKSPEEEGPKISEAAKGECAKAVTGAPNEDSRKRRCSYATHSTNKVCIYSDGECIPATRCGQLQHTACNKDSIAGVLCSYDAADPNKVCTQRYACEQIADISQCDGKSTMDPLGAMCRVFPTATQKKCLPYPKTSKNTLWQIIAGPDAIVVKASYHALEKQDHWLTFGANTTDRLVIPQDVVKVQALAKDYACGVTKTDTTLCWGDTSQGKTAPPAGLKFQKIEAKEAFACGLIGNAPHKGKIACWGNVPALIQNRIDAGFIKLEYNFQGGMLGTKLTEAREFRDFALTNNQLCGVLAESEDPYNKAALGGGKDIGYVFCSSNWNPNPTNPAFQPSFRQIFSGKNFFCGLRWSIDNRAVCWYDHHANPNDNMNKGAFFKTAGGAPDRSGTDYATLALGDDFGCFFESSPSSLLKTGKMSCLAPSGAVLTTPQGPPAGLGELSSHAAGPNFACVVKDDTGKILCFGSGAQAIQDTVPEILRE